MRSLFLVQIFSENCLCLRDIKEISKTVLGSTCMNGLNDIHFVIRCPDLFLFSLSLVWRILSGHFEPFQVLDVEPGQAIHSLRFPAHLRQATGRRWQCPEHLGRAQFTHLGRFCKPDAEPIAGTPFTKISVPRTIEAKISFIHKPVLRPTRNSKAPEKQTGEGPVINKKFR